MANSWIQEAEENAKKYADAIKQQSQYLIDQQNQAKENSIQTNENDRINAINQLNANKETARQTALDNAKQANINRVLALKDNQNAMSRAGLSTQGVVGSQVNSINNNYGTDLNNILRQRANQLQEIDNQVNSANKEYDTNRLNLINQYEQNIASLNSQIDQQALNQYNTIYQAYLNQKQQEEAQQLAEAQRQEAIRQYNETMAYQKAKDDADRQLAYAQLAASKARNSNYPFTDDPETSKVTQIKTDYYSGDINPDTKHGTFGTLDSNGIKYQPNNVGGKKLKSSGFRVKDLFSGATGKDGASLDNQRIWSTGDNWYVWDGSVNKYKNVTLDVSRAILRNPSIASKIK